MNVNSFYTSTLYQSFYEVCDELAHSSTKDQFERALMKLDIRHQDPVRHVADLIENHTDFFDFKDVQMLHQITKNISKYLTTNDSIYKIQAVYQNILDKQIKHFRFNLSNKTVYEKLKEMVKQAPLEEGVQLIEIVESLFKTVKDLNDRIKLLKVIEKMSQELKFLKLLASLIKGIENSDEILEIFDSIQRLPEEQSLSIIELALPLIKDVKKLKQKVSILFTIAAFPQEQRASILELMHPLIEYGQAYRGGLLEFSRKLLPQQRAYGTELVLSLFEEIKSKDKRKRLIANLELIPEGQGVSILELVLPFIKTIPDESQKIDILSTIIAFPAEHRASHIKPVISLFQEVAERDQSMRQWCILIIKKLPLQHMASSIPLIASLFQEIKDADQARGIWLLLFH
jgi:hypothetical protein